MPCVPRGVQRVPVIQFCGARLGDKNRDVASESSLNSQSANTGSLSNYNVARPGDDGGYRAVNDVNESISDQTSAVGRERNIYYPSSAI